MDRFYTFRFGLITVAVWALRASKTPQLAVSLLRLEYFIAGLVVMLTDSRNFKNASNVHLTQAKLCLYYCSVFAWFSRFHCRILISVAITPPILRDYATHHAHRHVRLCAVLARYSQRRVNCSRHFNLVWNNLSNWSLVRHFPTRISCSRCGLRNQAIRFCRLKNASSTRLPRSFEIPFLSQLFAGCPDAPYGSLLLAAGFVRYYWLDHHHVFQPTLRQVCRPWARGRRVSRNAVEKFCYNVNGPLHWLMTRPPYLYQGQPKTREIQSATKIRR